jgi:hypothetical protein
MEWDSLSQYFDYVLGLLDSSGGSRNDDASSVVFDEDNELGILQADVRFPDGSRLEVFLSVAWHADGYPDWRRYGFHYMDRDNLTRFRYDNAPHYPGLPNFPHHKHPGSGESVIDCAIPSIRHVLEDVRDYLSDVAG